MLIISLTFSVHVARNSYNPTLEPNIVLQHQNSSANLSKTFLYTMTSPWISFFSLSPLTEYQVVPTISEINCEGFDNLRNNSQIYSSPILIFLIYGVATHLRNYIEAGTGRGILITHKLDCASMKVAKQSSAPNITQSDPYRWGIAVQHGRNGERGEVTATTLVSSSITFWPCITKWPWR